MPGIHVFVFCCAEHSHLAGDCVHSIRQNIKDTILSINIVSNVTINIDGCNLILDHIFWQKLDPYSKCARLYKTNWIKQQIFKLAVNQYVSGNALVVDAEVLFLKPMAWLNKNKHVFYTSYSQYYQPYFNLNRALLNLDKLSEYSFITDTMLFSTEVLKNIQEEIEARHHMPWIEALDHLLFENKDNWLSEFELYGNYVLDKYPDLVDHVKPPIHHLVDMPDRTNYEFTKLLDTVKKKATSDFVSMNIAHRTGKKTAWLSFYYLVKAPDWPDCENEADFIKLPLEIQQECIEIHGYKFNK